MFVVAGVTSAAREKGTPQVYVAFACRDGRLKSTSRLVNHIHVCSIPTRLLAEHPSSLNSLHLTHDQVAGRVLPHLDEDIQWRTSHKPTEAAGHQIVSTTDPADTTPDKLESAGHPFGRGCNFGTHPPNLCVLARIGDRPFQQIVCDLLNALVRAVGAGPVRPRDHVAGGTG